MLKSLAAAALLTVGIAVPASALPVPGGAAPRRAGRADPARLRRLRALRPPWAVWRVPRRRPVGRVCRSGLPARLSSRSRRAALLAEPVLVASTPGPCGAAATRADGPLWTARRFRSVTVQGRA